MDVAAVEVLPGLQSANIQLLRDGSVLDGRCRDGLFSTFGRIARPVNAAVRGVMLATSFVWWWIVARALILCGAQFPGLDARVTNGLKQPLRAVVHGIVEGLSAFVEPVLHLVGPKKKPNPAD